MRDLSQGDFIFQQDGARAHTSKATIEYLEMKGIQYIKPEHWPPHSCDLNPCDYSIWGVVEAKLWSKKHYESLDDLKKALQQVWNEFPQENIDNAINDFRKRYKLVVFNEGGNIDKYVT